MQIGPACNLIAPSRSITVTGPFLPWQREFVVAKEEQVNSPGIAQPVISGQEVGQRLFTMEPLKELSWLELDIRPVGTRLYTAADPVPTVDRVQSAAFPLKEWTPVKVRATWYLPGGFATRSFEFDIGTGVIITVPPTNKVDVDILVPSETGLGDVVIPDAFDIHRAAGLRFATQVQCKATCVYSPTVTTPRFTQLVYLPVGDPEGSIGASVRLMPYATAAQILADNVTSVDLVIGDIEAVYSVDVQPRVQGQPLDALSGVMPVFPIDFDTPNVSKKVPVPQSHANVVRVRITDNAKDANVLVIQDINGL